MSNTGDDLYELVASVRSTSVDVQRYLACQVQERPRASIGVAVGLGYVLGGGLNRQLTGIGFGAAIRLAATVLVRELYRGVNDEAAPVPRQHRPEGDSSGASEERL